MKLDNKHNRIFPDDADRLMNIDETAARLRTSPIVIGKLIKAGMLTSLRFGNSKRIRKVTLNQFLETYDGQDVLAILEQKLAKT